MLCRLHSVYKIATAYTLWYYTEALKLLYSKVPIFHVQSWKNYTGQKKFTQAPPVVPVTNRRYAYMCICSCEVLKLSKARNGLEEWTRSWCASIGLSSLTAISRVVLFIKILEGSIPLFFSFLQDYSPPKSPNSIKYHWSKSIFLLHSWQERAHWCQEFDIFLVLIYASWICPVIFYASWPFRGSCGNFSHSSPMLQSLELSDHVKFNLKA